MKFLKILVFFIAIQMSAQQGGMWIPSLLQGMNENDMQSLGSKLTAADIYSVNASSLKDAVVHFNGGCTAEVISPKGLLLTNHHCGFGQIQSHSSLENDYLKDGFWASTLADELPNNGLYVEFIVRIEDVTQQVLEGVTETMTDREKQSKIGSNSATIERETKKEDWQGTKIKAFYKGNQYFLFVTERYDDIRLVGAPPSSIGKFGSDTDNWVWPRHTGDFSLFRIYANKQNQPAKYSKDNVPFKPKHFLPIGIDGISEDDFTMVFGFPGTTDEYLPAIAIAQTVEKINPKTIAIREAALKVIDANMKTDDHIRIQYASKQARIANAWKKWIGENLGIKKSGAIAKRKDLESEFTKALETKKLLETYGHILPELERLYNAIEETAVKRRMFIEAITGTSELMQLMFRLTQVENAAMSSDADFERLRTNVLSAMDGLYKNMNLEVDKGIYLAVMPFYTTNIDASIYEKTAFKTLETGKKLLEGTSKEVLEKLNNDAAYQYAKVFVSDFYNNIEPVFRDINPKINALEQQYMKALMMVLPNQRYFPDANGTLRVTYGKVKGYEPRDAVYYEPITYLDGVMEKYVPGDYEFDVPQKLQELYAKKDYGPYADATGKLPVCFIGTNHTTGGNSGSPAIDAYGNLVGLNFDRVWEGTMSDMYYDPEICRNIMVDVRYVLFIIDKYAGAKHLINEMKLVRNKGKK